MEKNSLTRSAGLFAAIIVSALGLTACGTIAATSPSGSSAATPGASQSATQSPSVATSPTASSISTASPASTAQALKQVPLPLNGQGDEFLSPSGNLGCEIDYKRQGVLQDTVYCQSVTPARSATLSTDGTYTTSTEIGNPGDPFTLAYGTEVIAGPFVCSSTTAGITCTANGKGFLISKSGITAATR